MNTIVPSVLRRKGICSRGLSHPLTVVVASRVNQGFRPSSRAWPRRQPMAVEEGFSLYRLAHSSRADQDLSN